MKTTMERVVDQVVASAEEVEFIELGNVSEETKGGALGGSYDGGINRKWP